MLRYRDLRLFVRQFDRRLFLCRDLCRVDGGRLDADHGDDPALPSGSPWAYFIPNQYAMQVRFDLGSGSTYATSTPNTWVSGNYETVSGAVELVAQTSGYCEFAAVHLQPGSIGGGYLARPYGDELALARRYHAKTFPEGTAPAQNAGVAGALCARTPVASAYASVYLAMPMGLYTGSGSSLSVTTYNPSNTNANFRDVTGSADVTATVDPASAKGGTGVEIATSATVATAGTISTSMRSSIRGSIDAPAASRSRAARAGRRGAGLRLRRAYIWGGALSKDSGVQGFYDSVGYALAEGFTTIRFTLAPGQATSYNISPDPCASTQSLACYAGVMFASSVWDNPNLTRVMFTAHDFTGFVAGGNSNNGYLTPSLLTANAAAIEAEYTALFNVLKTRFAGRSIQFVISNWKPTT